MALPIQISTDFMPSAINFSKLRKNKMGGKAVYLSSSNNNKLYIQLPFMRAPFGLSSYTDEATKKDSIARQSMQTRSYKRQPSSEPACWAPKAITS